MKDPSAEEERSNASTPRDTYAFQEWKVAQGLVRTNMTEPLQAPLGNDESTHHRDATPKEPRDKRRIILLLSMVAVALTLAVVLIVTLSMVSSDKESTQQTNIAEKDPPNDVTAPPPTSVAPIVPGNPTMSPSTIWPTISPVTQRPSPAPVVAQSAPGILERLVPLVPYATVFTDETSIYNKAYRSIGAFNDIEQRFAVAVLNFALSGTFASATLPTCDWFGITCERDQVTAIAWPNQALFGSLPTMGLESLTSLVSLDLGENKIQGTIPAVLYALTHLEFLYLHENILTGTLSTRIGQLNKLRRLYLGDNQLTGMLPQELGSPGLGGANVRPLRTWNRLFSQFQSLTILQNISVSTTIIWWDPFHAIGICDACFIWIWARINFPERFQTIGRRVATRWIGCDSCTWTTTISEDDCPMLSVKLARDDCTV